MAMSIPILHSSPSLHSPSESPSLSPPSPSPSPLPPRCWTVTFAQLCHPASNISSSASWLICSRPLSLLVDPSASLLRLRPSQSLSPLDFCLPRLFLATPSHSSSPSSPFAPLLFAAFRHLPTNQKHKFVLRFHTTAELRDCLTCIQAARTQADSVQALPQVGREDDAILPVAARDAVHTSPFITDSLGLTGTHASPIPSLSSRQPHVNAPQSNGWEVGAARSPPTASTTSSSLVAVQRVAHDNSVLWKYQGTHRSDFGPRPSTSEVNHARGCSLDMERRMPIFKKRRTNTTTTWCVDPPVRCTSMPAALITSLDPASRSQQTHDDNVLDRRNGDDSSGVCDFQDLLVNEPARTPIPIGSEDKGTLNWSHEHVMQPSEYEPATETVDCALPTDLQSGDLQSQLLGCLLDPTFRTLVAQVERILLEMESPENTDLEAVAKFLALRT